MVKFLLKMKYRPSANQLDGPRAHPGYKSALYKGEQPVPGAFRPPVFPSPSIYAPRHAPDARRNTAEVNSRKENLSLL
jgi:hypothetical protein